MKKITEIEWDIKETNEIKGMVIINIKTTKRAELEDLEKERINKIIELESSSYWLFISLGK